MVNLEQFREAKSALIHHYASNRASHGVHLIGFTAGLFTLIQIVQNSESQPLSGIFKNVSVIFSGIPPIIGEFFKLMVFFVGIWVLLFFIIRTIFRFAVFAYFAEYSLAVGAKETYRRSEPIHEAIHLIVIEKVIEANKRLYWRFPLSWFVVRRGKESEHHQGYRLCGIIALGLAFVLVSLLW